MPWLPKVKGVLNSYLGGQAGGEAVADILSGRQNPCGKLAETYPLSLSDVQCVNYYPGTVMTTEYRDSVYIGYRYYDTAKKDVLFPFGFGLSYTEFKYSALKLSKKKLKDTETLTVSFKVKNVGSVAGAEISQVYVSDAESTIYRPAKELRGFSKTFLEPGEEKTVTVELSKRAFAYYNVKGKVTVESTAENVTVPDYRAVAPEYYTADVQSVSDEAFTAVLGHEIPSPVRGNEPFTLLDSLERTKDSKWGGRINTVIDKALNLVFKESNSTVDMVKAMALQIPIRNFITMSSGVFTEEMANGLLMILNDGESTVKGAGKILAGLGSAVMKLPALLKMV